MGALKNAKKEKFAQEILKGKSQRQAYLTAFPSAKKWKIETVDNNACKLFNSDEVLTRVEELKKEAAHNAILDRQGRMLILTDIAMDAEEKTDSRIKAIDTLNKMDGDYVTKLEVMKPIDETVKEMEAYFFEQNANPPDA